MSQSVRSIAVAAMLLGVLCPLGQRVMLAESAIPIPEEELLDVGILVPGPGLEKRGYLLTGVEYTSDELRQSEAAFMAVHLMQTLQETRNFGLVRMLPSNSISADLFVTGLIRESSARRLVLELVVRDAMGHRWFKKVYKQKAQPSSYAFAYHSNVEPFQELYGEFAADLVLAQSRRKPEYLKKLRRVAELRFAAQLAPGIFGDYLHQNQKGRIELKRLPSIDDPMLVRVRAIQVRDEYFLDLLAERYQEFYRSMDRPYDNFRATRYDVEVSLSDARARAILADARLNPRGTDETYWETLRAQRDEKYFRGQAANQVTYLDEISNEFAIEVNPLKLELEGEVIRFEGTIEEQYRQWQELLEKVFETETGMSAKNRKFPKEVRQ